MYPASFYRNRNWFNWESLFLYHKQRCGKTSGFLFCVPTGIRIMTVTGIYNSPVSQRWKSRGLGVSSLATLLQTCMLCNRFLRWSNRPFSRLRWRSKFFFNQLPLTQPLIQLSLEWNSPGHDCKLWPIKSQSNLQNGLRRYNQALTTQNWWTDRQQPYGLQPLAWGQGISHPTYGCESRNSYWVIAKG